MQPPGWSHRSVYRHTQRAPLCVLIYALGLVFLATAWSLRANPAFYWSYGLGGLAILALAASIHHLTVEGRDEGLRIAFGPLPLFHRLVPWVDIVTVDRGRTMLLDGWGIHWSPRGGWVWNLWGRDCVVLRLRQGTLRVGSDDAENLVRFLKLQRPAELESALTHPD